MEKVLVRVRIWAENPCDCGDHAEGCVVDDGDDETYLYACWCGKEVRVAQDDAEVLEAIAAAGAV